LRDAISTSMLVEEWGSMKKPSVLLRDLDDFDTISPRAG